MKSFTTAATLGMIAMATASPMAHAIKRQTTSQCLLPTVMNPSQSDVLASIQQWNSDVNSVNAFLNMAGSLSGTELQDQAQAAKNSADDEPCQLMTLASQPQFASGPDAFTCAASDLMAKFQSEVLDNLSTIINPSSNTSAIASAVGDINIARCCNVLGDASILWQDSAIENNVNGTSGLQTVAPFEDACADIG